MLISLYRAAPAFLDCAPRTRADYQRVLDYLQPIGDTPLSRFDAPTIARIRDKAAQKGRCFGNYAKQVLSILFGWGSERGYVPSNPVRLVKGIKRQKGAPEGLTLYGLRHTVAVILREAGHDERTIADALGQKTIEMAWHCAKGANLRHKMRGTVASFDAEMNKRGTSLTNRSDETVKPPLRAGCVYRKCVAFSVTCFGTAGWSRTTDLRSHNPTL